MTVIDNNTLFYLRGDSLESLCPTSFTTTITSVSIIDRQESGFVKALDFNGGTSSYVISNLGDLFKGDWTVELFYDLDSTAKKKCYRILLFNHR